VRCDLSLEGLSDADLADLAQQTAMKHDGLCTCGKGRCSDVFAYKKLFSELNESFRAEIARRRLVRSQEADALAYDWYGRLSPE
jgi:hypothetical protein